MNDEYTPRNPAPQEPQDAQPQQAAQSVAPQSIGSPVAVLAPAPANVTSDNLILTANGYKPLITCISERYTGPQRFLYPINEIGISRLYADIFAYRLRYVTERKKWYIFNGRYWEESCGQEMELCKLLVKNYRDYWKAYSKAPTKKQRSFLENLTSRHVRENLLKDAASVNPIRMSDFDKNPMLFNCENGTIDLNTCTLYSHNPDDLITKIAHVTYDPNTRCARWEQHILQIMEDDTAKAEYLQKAFGMCLTGENRYECFFILYGPTSRNGKGTTMETIMTMMGDYGKAARPDTITQRQSPNGSGPSEDIARLAGARIVNVSEPDKKMTLSSALVKTLTGNDTVTARYLHENSFEFKPGFKFLINTNYLPQIPDPSVFTSGRVKVIPFMRHFDGNQQDKNLKHTLAQPQNLSGILNWCLDGWKLLQTQGFEEPDSVIAATAQYQQDSDKVALFLEERLTPSPGINMKLEDVYADYKSWCETNGLRPEGKPRFKQTLGAHVKIDRSRSVGADRLKNAVVCVCDYSFQVQFSDICAPLTNEELNAALAPYGIKFYSGPSINTRIDASSYGEVVMSSPDNRNS